MGKKKTYYETAQKYSLDKEGNLLSGGEVVKKKGVKRKYKLWGSTEDSVTKDLVFESDSHANSVANNLFIGSLDYNVIKPPPDYKCSSGIAIDFKDYKGPCTCVMCTTSIAHSAKPAGHGRLKETDQLPALQYIVSFPPGTATKKEVKYDDKEGYYYWTDDKPAKSTLEKVIIALNDRHGWTREQIAAWLYEISDPTGENGPDIRFKLPTTGENNEQHD